MIKVAILVFERIDHEEYRTKIKIKHFSEDTTIRKVEEWIKSITPHKDISDAYFTKP